MAVDVADLVYSVFSPLVYGARYGRGGRRILLKCLMVFIKDFFENLVLRNSHVVGGGPLLVVPIEVILLILSRGVF